jgi:rRNA-processing protein FCF1
VDQVVVEGVCELLKELLWSNVEIKNKENTIQSQKFPIIKNNETRPLIKNCILAILILYERYIIFTQFTNLV